MREQSRLVELMRAYLSDPEIMASAEVLADEIAEEVHLLAHQYLSALPVLPAPCEPLTDLLLGMMKVGFAQAVLAARPPEEERGASGPIMSDDKLRKLLDDVNL